MISRALLVATAVTVSASGPRAADARALGAASPAEASTLGVAEGLADDARGDAKAQVEFGIKVAQNGLWKEATYRWQKAVEIDPTYGAALNNLAIA